MVMTTEYGRFRFYAVRRGRVLDIYRSREECEQQVNGFRNNEHRGFHDLSEALAWLRSAASPPAHQPTPHVQPVRRKPSRLLKGVFCSILFSQQVSSVIVVADSQHSGDESGGSNPAGMNVTEPKADGKFMYEINSNDERVLFGFTVVLPHNGIGLDLMGHGSLCYEERVARQEVSFTMLDMIFGAIGYTIHDYNYHILGRVKERMNRSRVDRVGRLTERICILEMENEELSGQVEMFGEMLEE
ncbi:Ribonuclease [Arachis hypogaea]|nr:Ribonuclease [Arachis hypogaea]